MTVLHIFEKAKASFQKSQGKGTADRVNLEKNDEFEVIAAGIKYNVVVPSVPEKRDWTAGGLTEADGPFVFSKARDAGAPTRFTPEANRQTGGEVLKTQRP